MIGTHRIVVQNKKIKYDFEIRRNITIIQGESATGKTALVDMIREYSYNGKDSGIDLNCDKTCSVLEGRTWNVQLSAITDSIVFIDEGNDFVSSKNFAAAIQETDNYYVIITREYLETIPYSVDEIYGIRNSGKYGYLKQTYNELYHVYGLTFPAETAEPDLVITEDSNSGYQFFQDICMKNELKCFPANGKSNIFSCLTKTHATKIVVIADGAAFGSEIGRIMSLIKIYNNVILYLPESFEWLILKSGVVNDIESAKILKDPSNYIESRLYLSWERYFSSLLIRKTQGTYLAYSKRILSQVYMQDSIQSRILNTIDNIDFQWKHSFSQQNDSTQAGK